MTSDSRTLLTAGRALGAVHGALSTVFYVFLLRSFLIKWRAKDRFALTRIPELTVFTATASLLVIYILDSNLIWVQWYTYSLALPIPLVFSSMVLPYMIRAILLWYRFGLCEEIVAKEVHSKNNVNWFRKNYKYFQPKFVLKVAFAVVSVIIAIAVLDFAVFKKDKTFSIVLYVIVGVVFMIVTFTFLFKVRFKFDVWNIRKELFIVVSIAVASFFSVLVISVIPSTSQLIGDNPDFTQLIIFTIILSIPFLLYMYMSLYYVLRSSNSGIKEFKEKLEMNETVNDVNKFELLLQDTEFYLLFQKHLIKELSVEHLAFWSQLYGFEQLSRNRDASINDITVYAQNILEAYISPSSLLEINISDSCRKKIIEDMKLFVESKGEFGRNLFLSAKTEILMLLARDSFIRFARTPEFLQFLERRTASNILSTPGVHIAPAPDSRSEEFMKLKDLVSPKLTVSPYQHLKAELAKIRVSPEIPEAGRVEVKEV